MYVAFLRQHSEAIYFCVISQKWQNDAESPVIVNMGGCGDVCSSNLLGGWGSPKASIKAVGTLAEVQMNQPHYVRKYTATFAR